MSGLLGFVVGGMAERLIPVLQTPVEDIIYEVLDQKGLPTRSEVRDLRNKLDRLEKTIADLGGSLESLKVDVDKAVDAADAARDAAASKPKAKAKAAPKAKADKKKPGKKAKSAAAPKVCRLDDCDSVVRAKGFCGKHYQKFKRSTLEGYVGSEGATLHENVKYLVSKDHVGELVETRYEGDEVIFLLPESGGKTLRLKVNDVRID